MISYLRKIIKWAAFPVALITVSLTTALITIYLLEEGYIQREARLQIAVQKRIENLIESGALEPSNKLTDELSSVDPLPIFEEDGRFIVSGVDGGANIWETDSGISEIDSESSSTSQPEGIRSAKLAFAVETYKVWALEHRRRVFQAHLLKDNILFVIVVAVVTFGIFLSYIQFRKSNEIEGSLKLGIGGVEVTSSVLGVFILAFSIGFLYLYLDQVFPIEVIGGAQRIERPQPGSEAE